MNQRRQDSDQKLLALIAANPDPDRLLIQVAADGVLLRAAERLLRAADGADPEAGLRLQGLCLAQGLTQQMALERLRLIASSLDLPASRPDHYRVLGIADSAGLDEIKRAFRKASLVWHPDRNPANAEAEKRFREIHQAYKTLSDPQRRAVYDQGRALFDQRPSIPTPADADPEPGAEPVRSRRRSVWPQFALVVAVLVAISFTVDYQRRISIPAAPKPHSPKAQQDPAAAAPPGGTKRPQSAAGDLATKKPPVGSIDPHRPDVPPVGAHSSASHKERILLGWEPAPPASGGSGGGIAPVNSAREPVAEPVAEERQTFAGTPLGNQRQVVRPSPGSDAASQPSDSMPAAAAPTAGVARQPQQESGRSPGREPGTRAPTVTQVPSPPNPAIATEKSMTAPASAKSEKVPKTPPETHQESVSPVNSAARDRPRTEPAVPQAPRESSRFAATPTPAPPAERLPSEHVGAAAPPAPAPHSRLVKELQPPTPPANPAPAAASKPAAPASGIVGASTEKRLLDFLNRYIAAYKRRDLATLTALFTPDAIENGRPFSALLPEYQANFQQMAAIDYKIFVDHWDGSPASRVKVSGRFELAARYRDQHRSAISGRIEFVLNPHADDFRVSRLAYSFQR